MDQIFTHYSPLLTNVSFDYQNDDLFAEQMAPGFPVPKRTGFVAAFGKEGFAQWDDARGINAEANEVPDDALGNRTFMCTNHSLKRSLSWVKQADADPALDQSVITVERLTGFIKLNQELNLANAILNNTGPNAPPSSLGAVPNTTLSGTSQWSDFVNSDPIAAIEAQKITGKQEFGKVYNTLAVSYPVYAALRQHPRIIDRFKYTQVGILQADHLKSAFDVENFWVLGAEYLATTTNFDQIQPVGNNLSYIWSNSAILGYIPSPGKREIAAAYTAKWTFAKNDDGSDLNPGMGNRDGAGAGLMVRRYKVDSKMADAVEVCYWYDFIWGDVNCMYVYNSAVGSPF